MNDYDNDLLKTLLDAIPNPFYIIDVQDYTIKIANSAAYNGSLPAGLTCHALAHNLTSPCHENNHICPIEKVIKTKKPVIVEHSHYDKDGSIKNVEVHAYPIFDDDRNVVQLIETSLDITERKKSNDQLNKTLKEQTTILNTANVGIAYVVNREFSWTNKKMDEIFGYDDKELYKAEVKLIYLCAESHKEIGNAAYPMMGEGAIYRTDYQLQRKDGSTVWCNISGAAIDPEEPLKGAIWIVEDISERKSMELELREAKEEAENNSKLKDKFVALVSHDLKGPICRIQNYLQMIRDSDIDIKTKNNFIDESLVACCDMSTLINEILDISRIKSGSLQPKQSFIDPKHTVRHIFLNYSNQAAQKGITITNEIPSDMLIYADKVLYLEVISNLMINAIKFCQEGDTITVNISKEEPSTLVIKDSGVGISKERLEKLTYYEEQTSTRGTADESGTGMGLPLVNDILKSHKGELSIESVVGEGSSFYIKLPHKKPSILIIDDSQLITDLIKESLKKIPADFHTALNGKKGLDIIENIHPDLILLDLELPDINGLELLTNIKNGTESRNIPVIIITGTPGSEIREKAFDMGADDFISKPFYAEDLIPRTKKFLAE